MEAQIRKDRSARLGRQLNFIPDRAILMTFKLYWITSIRPNLFICRMLTDFQTCECCVAVKKEPDCVEAHRSPGGDQHSCEMRTSREARIDLKLQRESNLALPITSLQGLIR